MFSLFIKGGPVMLLLLACSFVGVYIIVEKLLFIKKNSIDNDQLLGRIKHQLVQAGKEQTLKDLQYDNRLMTQVVRHIIASSDLQKQEIQAAIKHETKEDIQTLEKNMDILSSIITVAPILGLLGTVLGLIEIFNVISGGGLGDPQALSGGIAQALITTVSGLSVAIPFIFGHQIIGKRIELFISKTESVANEMLHFCKTNGGIKA